MHRGLRHMHCEDTTKLQHDYYMDQVGGGLPHFIGAENQRGHGLGTVISGVLKQALPLLRSSFAQAVKRKALKAGLGVAGDLLRGKSLKTAVKNRALETIGFATDTYNSQSKQAKNKKRPIRRSAPKKRVSFGPATRGRASRYRNTILH